MSPGWISGELHPQVSLTFVRLASCGLDAGYCQQCIKTIYSRSLKWAISYCAAAFLGLKFVNV